MDSNYTNENKEYSLETEKTAVDVIDTVLYSAERFVKIQKLAGAQEKRRQKARDENSKLLKEMEEQLKTQQERDTNAALEDVRLRNQSHRNAREKLKRQLAEREAERKKHHEYTREKMNCLKMKGELLKYTFGQKLMMSTFKAEGLDVSDMDKVIVTLFGPTGSGKTSFIGK